MSEELENSASPSEEEFDDVEEEKQKAHFPKWNELQFIPNKKRFLILAILFSALQITGIIAFTFGFLNRYEEGLFDFGIFIFAPFTGLAISYLVESKKEAVAVSAVVGGISISISLIVYVIFESTLGIPQPLEFNVYTLIAIPLVFYLLEIALAFTLARIRGIYRQIGDSTIPRDSDKAMIEELRQNRIARGLEEPHELEATPKEPEDEAN